MIDIEPLIPPKTDDVKEEESFVLEKKGEGEKKSLFIRGASGRSTMDGSVMSGSLDVHFHTGAAPSPVSMGASENQEKKNQTSPKEKTYLETELPVYEKDESCSAENTNEKSDTKLESRGIEKEDNNQGPPQVWISKSLSMEQGLNIKEDE